MKATIVIGGFLSLMSLPAVAQQVENDDMYFTAKDREKLRVAMAETPAVAVNTTKPKQQQKELTEEVIIPEDLNPTDSYSARTINPEYISRVNSEQASEDEQNYYLEGYTATNTFDSYSASQFSNTSNCGTCWNSYPNSYYGGSAWNYYSPYYGYNDPWRTPYYGMSPGWNMSLGYLFGGWGSGWNLGLSYTWGNAWVYNPYYYNPYYHNPYNYSPYSYSNRGYQYAPNSNTENGVIRRTRTLAVTPTQRVSSVNNTSDTNGRMRSSTTDEYYVKPSRRISQSTDYSNPLYRQNSTSEFQRSRSTNSSGFERFMNDSSPSRSSGSSFERSRSSSSFSSPSRSSGGGSSGGSRPRGRN
jgi:hypothetical protein